MAQVITGDPTAAIGKMARSQDPKIKMLLERFRRSTRRRDNWLDLWQDIVDYCMPQREDFYESVVGSARTDAIFDETAVDGLPRFASRVLNGIWPPHSRAFSMTFGKYLPQELQTIETQRALDEVTVLIHEGVANSNFQSEAHEMMQDVGIGTGNLLTLPGRFTGDLVFDAVPLTRIVLEPGPMDRPQAWFRWKKMALGDVEQTFLGAKLPEKMAKRAQKTEPEMVTIMEATYRDWQSSNEKYGVCLIALEDEEILREETIEGDGSCPWASPRWSKSALEVYGRGPLVTALPAIRTVNLVTELILENAQIQSGGIFTYDDDGVLNPETIVLQPGVFIPKRQGSEVMPLQTGGNFDLSQFVIHEMQMNIRRALFIGEFETKGATPRSALEVAERRFDVAQDIGAAAGRLKVEFLYAVVRRIVHIYRKQGLINLPLVDGKQIKMIAESPLVRTQNQQDITDFLRYQESLRFTFGESSMALNKLLETAQYLAELHGVPAKLIPTRGELKAQLEQAVNVGQQIGAIPGGGQGPGQPGLLPGG